MKTDAFHISAVNKNSVYSSDFYEIKFLNHTECHAAITGWNDNFCVTYIHSGIFLFELFRHQYNLHTGCILLDKPQCGYRILPATGQCTIIRFYPQFYNQLLMYEEYKKSFFLSNKNLLSISLKSNPAIDYLHYKIYHNKNLLQKLEMDILVMEILKNTLSILSDDTCEKEQIYSYSKHHIPAIELAKNYMYKNLSTNISLSEIATHACISPFHFSRVFKHFTTMSPHQYLLNLRLAKGEHLLKNGNMPISKVAQLSGFKTPEYFATSFKQKYGKNPTDYKRLLQAL